MSLQNKCNELVIIAENANVYRNDRYFSCGMSFKRYKNEWQKSILEMQTW